MSKIKIFLVPYAGASVYVYYSWEKKFPYGYEVCLNELAGRGSRFNEPFYKSIDQAADELAKKIIENLNENDEYILFGHSMGATIAYEMYYKLREYGAKMPKHIFFSGRKPPHTISEKYNIENMNNDAFLEFVKKFGGLQNEFFDKQVKELFLPILREDFKLVDNYIYHPKNCKIDCNVSVLYGKNDKFVSKYELMKWTDVCENKINFYGYDGGHFFLNNQSEKIINLIIKEVQ